MVESKSGSYLAGNLYWDATNWQRFDTASGGAMLTVSAAGALNFWTTPAGANPATVTNMLAVTNTGNVTVTQGSFSGNGSVPGAGGSGYVLTKNSGTAYDYSWALPYNPSEGVRVTFLNVGSGQFTPQATTKTIVVECLGAGGGGGGVKIATASNTGAGGGGGGGAYTQAIIYSASIQGFYNYTVGAGGTAGNTAGSAGGTGGATSFGSVTSAAGGVGGGGDTVGGAAPKAGGVAGGGGYGGSTGGYLAAGGDGCQGLVLGANAGASGNGGGCARGGGVTAGRIGVGNLAGTAGAVPSGGGSGALAVNTTGVAGGVGADGKIIVWEYP
jgi:hypothetical protein